MTPGKTYIGLLIGETIRETIYAEKKHKLYSVLHILLNGKSSYLVICQKQLLTLRSWCSIILFLECPNSCLKLRYYIDKPILC